MSDSALEFLVGSSVRPATLRSLRSHGPLSSRGLEDRVAASRRTLKRTLGEMESRGWVRPVDGGYELTSLGGTFLEAYEAFRDRERLADRLRPVFELTPAEVIDPDVDALTDATVVHPGDDPTEPIDRLVELRADAAHLRECAPYLLYDSVDQLATRVTDERPPPDVTLVLEDDQPPMERFPAGYRERFETLLDAPSVDVYAYPGDVRFALGVADDHAFVVGVDPDEGAHTLLETADAAAVDWGERRFESYRAASALRE
jgi:predicted transcriptional regulator